MTQTIEDPKMDLGETEVRQAGAEGEKVKVYKVGYKEDQEVSRELVDENVIKEPIEEIIAEGTRRCDPNYFSDYNTCVPIASDVDCAGGSGNGPVYVNGPVLVTGRDIYGLDGDGDGVGCE